MSSFKAGAFRASIVVTWVAVVFDFVAKLQELALAGDKNALGKIEDFSNIVKTGDVGKALEFERGILVTARDEFEFIGPLAYSDLVRLHEDRNKCAHPSMLDPDTDFQPSPEAARYHIVNAVLHVLEHGPAQGKAALDRLLGELEMTYFPASVEELVVHLEHGPLGRPRASLIRNYLTVLLKSLFEPLPPPPTGIIESLGAQLDRDEKRRRVLTTLQAVARMYRQKSFELFEDKLDALVTKVDDDRLSAVALLCEALPELWTTISDAQQGRLVRFVRGMPPQDMPASMHSAWTVPELREAAIARLNCMTASTWAALGKSAKVPTEWIDVAVEQLTRAADWDAANPIKAFLVPRAQQLQDIHVRRILESAAENADLQSSWAVKDILGALAASPDFGPARVVSLVKEVALAEVYKSEPWWPEKAGG